MIVQTRHEPIWRQQTTLPEFPAQQGDLAVDVAVVGGGITGLTTALMLAEKRRRVALLEARRLGAGVTGCTSAHLDALSDVRLTKLLEAHGERTACTMVSGGREAIQIIESNCARYGIECELRRIPAYIFTDNPDDIEFLNREADAARKLGLDAMMISEVPLPFSARGALRVEGEGRLQPLDYLKGLATTLTGLGGIIHEQTRVIDIDGESPVRLKTSHGTVIADDVVLATHSPIGLRLTLHTRLPAYRSYLLAVRIDRPFTDAIFWDTAEPYHYLRRLSDVQPDVVLVGGADHKTGERENTETCYAELERYARERLDAREVLASWSAQVFETSDQIPFIGPDPMHDHVYVATGFAGTGMTLGTLAALLITRQIMGDPHGASQVFLPSRLNIVRSAKNFVMENLDAARRFIGDRLKAHPSFPTALAPGEGRIVELDGEKVALYQDDGGVLHALSPVCPHAGCHVHWNSAERSWDCPCHGSRYTATGEVLDGPTMRPLERLQR